MAPHHEILSQRRRDARVAARSDRAAPQCRKQSHDAAPPIRLEFAVFRLFSDGGVRVEFCLPRAADPSIASSLRLLESVPGIVPASSQNGPLRANSNQLARLDKSLKGLDLLRKTKMAERLIGV